MRMPYWLTQQLPDTEVIDKKFSLLESLNLNTVCKSARCPNLGTCFKEGALTFMILGDTCTRDCRFCAVKKSKEKNLLVDYKEPENIAKAIYELGIDYAIVTSVTRDDLEDRGAWIFSYTIREIREISPRTTIEVLIPDFAYNADSIKAVAQAGPDVIAHNLETVPRLFDSIKSSKSNYKSSLSLLKMIKGINPFVITKSSLMLGMGESSEEVIEVMRDLRDADCDIISLGQYLAPSRKLYPVAEYLTPGQFDRYKDSALSFGFKAVASGPLVRSSYKAKELFNKCMGLSS